MMESMPKQLKVLSWLTIVLVAIALYLSIWYAPREAVMGDVQRVFYFHVAAGWVGALAFLVAAVAGVLLLLRREHRYDIMALASVEIGIVFTFINIVSGSIWARPIWNTWWTWDPRLITATIMALVYLAYVMLRQGVEDPDRRARFAAVYGIIGFLSVPLTFLSIRIFRSIHPVVFGAGDALSSGMEGPRMQAAFFISLLTFSFIYVTLLWHRVRLQQLSEQLEMQKMKLLSAED
jgi:heme exporter protein C